ncbi:hypothetical protein H8F22_11285 [Pseudomonas sp. P154a]|uniref:hypothetical protein n=1 Tax=Pseudomonas mucoides TaxID=2730424 RepID=UPI0018920761|nr:hypothetical protein [Pseudomonas mucoides]MBF6039455.1 hypothetical protein [Pseudomonas mucoides]
MDAALWANVIAGVAFAVSIVSAILAWRSAREARLANRISIHEYQRKLYEAFADAFHLIQREGQHADLNEFARLTVHIKTAQLYVDESISNELQKFYDAYIVVYDATCKVKHAYAESAEASKRHLVGGNMSPLAKSLSDRADIFAEQCQLEADYAVDNVLKIGADLDKHFIEKIKLT